MRFCIYHIAFQVQILARQNLLKNEPTNYVWFPIIAHEKQWALTTINITIKNELQSTVKD